MIKIAFPTNDGINIFPHFGRAQQFKVVTLIENQPPSTEMRANNDQCNHKHLKIHESHGSHHHTNKFNLIKDCHIVIAGGMGQHAYDTLTNLGIQVLLPNEREIDAALTAYKQGTLISNRKRVHAHHRH